MVIVSPLTCLSLTSCLLSCKGVTHAAHRGNEKIRILWEKIKFVASFLQPAFSTFLTIVPDFRFLQSARMLLPARAYHHIAENRPSMPAS